jgi:hypothetical protein
LPRASAATTRKNPGLWRHHPVRKSGQQSGLAGFKRSEKAGQLLPAFGGDERSVDRVLEGGGAGEAANNRFKGRCGLQPGWSGVRGAAAYRLGLWSGREPGGSITGFDFAANQL